MEEELSKDKEMSFLGHLEELRWTLVKSTVVILIIAIVLFIFTGQVVETVFMSMLEADFPTYKFMCSLSHTLQMGDALCASDIPVKPQSILPTSQFTTNMYFAFIGGFIIAFPFVFYQFFSFIRPALKDSEFSVARGSIFWASLLFLLGIGFGYFLISPLCVQFFGTYSIAENVSNDFTISSFISLITTTTLFSGLFFELPMVIMILTKLGILSPEVLRQYRKHALIGILILSAVITPPDVVSQILVALPVLILYEIGILVAVRVQRNKPA